ncbi:MAG TPA: hypothetical protein VGO66_05395 [Solirubrobacterales bacterium]|nr:hypothetical protein [Solirubrobacterales bacterium]
MPGKWTRKADRTANRALERAHPPLVRLEIWARPKAVWLWLRIKRAGAWTERRALRAGGAWLFRRLDSGDRWTRRVCAGAVRASTRASAIATPGRAIGTVIVLAAACLIVSQFIDYRAVEIGQPGYAGLPDAAQPPTVGTKAAGDAHSYLLIPVALLAAVLGVLAVRARRRSLGLVVAALGLLCLAVILLIDMPAGLDESTQSVRFTGAKAVLSDGFYAELAAATGLVIGGLLYYARPCRIPINLSGRAASARRRRPRRQASSQARVARRA